MVLHDGPTSLQLSDYVHRKSIEAVESISPGDARHSGNSRFEMVQPSVEVYIDGSLVKVTTERIKVNSDGNGEKKSPRGAVVSFSRGSRRRLLRLIAKTDRGNKPLFVTLTYPDVFNGDFEKWKRDMDVFGKRFVRAFKGGSFVWRVEFMPRKTGSSKGLIAPHYHLLVWGVRLSELREFADRAWFDAVGSGSKAHFKAGVRCQYIRKWSGTISYVSKYIAKIDELPLTWKGRVWGVVARKNVPWSAIVVIFVDNDVAVRTVRLARKMMGLTGKVLRYGVTWMINGDRFMDYLEWTTGVP